ncbi:MAG TPA: 2-oxoisovalerate dehydrogenase [bacterium]|nr:2-oxoisovalerate dehydrogenase [bacterium]HPC76702.1 2-oxoisovalerate dehydrogenase [bacterium]
MKVKEIIFTVEEDPEGGYNASALGYSIFTEGDSLEELRENIKDAIRCHFDSAEDMPDIIRLHIVREETFTYA